MEGFERFYKHFILSFLVQRWLSTNAIDSLQIEIMNKNLWMSWLDIWYEAKVWQMLLPHQCKAPLQASILLLGIVSRSHRPHPQTLCVQHPPRSADYPSTQEKYNLMTKLLPFLKETWVVVVHAKLATMKLGIVVGYPGIVIYGKGHTVKMWD